MKTLMSLIVLFLPLLGFSQNADEWLHQRRTQKKYLLEQIAALQVFIDYAQKGNKIADNGITTIKRIKNGDFSMHRDFFRSLSLVNPSLKKYVDLGEIVSLQILLVINGQKTIRFAIENKQFSPAELLYCRKVFEKIAKDCLGFLEEILRLTTDNELEMNDASRLKRIDNLISDMQNCYMANSSTSKQVKLLTLQRIREQNEVDRSKSINGVK